MLSNNENEVLDYFDSEGKEATFSHYSNGSTLIIPVRLWMQNFSELGHSGRKVMRTGEEQEKLKQEF
jgi:hypothetical protein